MRQTNDDPVIDEIRQARQRISERCGHDPDQLVAYYLEMQQRLADRLLPPASPPPRADQPVA